MKLLPLLGAIAGLVTSAQGATIVWQSFADNGLALADGTTMLPVNSLVRLGYFDISDAEIKLNISNLAFLDSKFHQLDFDRIGGAEVVGAAGYFSEAQTGVDTTSSGGKQLVVWAFASADNSSINQSLLTATQTGIFYMDKGVNSAWGVPTDNDFGQTSIDLTNLTGNGPTADLLSGANIVAGTFTQNQAGQLNSRNFALQVVPEPASAGLALVGGATLLLRRRRLA